MSHKYFWSVFPDEKDCTLLFLEHKFTSTQVASKLTDIYWNTIFHGVFNIKSVLLFGRVCLFNVAIVVGLWMGLIWMTKELTEALLHWGIGTTAAIIYIKPFTCQ